MKGFNKREHHRIPMRQRAEISGGPATVVGDFLNISLTGAYITVPDSETIPQKISIAAGDFGKLWANVIRRDRSGIGVLFQLSELETRKFQTVYCNYLGEMIADWTDAGSTRPMHTPAGIIPETEH